MQYLIVKHSHITFVAITILLFNLRFWMRCAKPENPLPKLLKIIPHFNDTLLLFTGLWLMKITHFTPFGNADWLGVKILILLAYIGLGMMTVKAQPRTPKANLGYVLSMACIVSIIYLAYYKPF
ncbi:MULTISPECIES: SirB2 family protein [unclassified Neisseria]|uniref:SirB2 family protein n=1 Tax=unclassified Neisseria TaxID=2623750 RepID=UPI0026651CB2|nr:MULTISPECIES: SirB2 family protein [unclassified Neisseria]MDO1509088.1 SirB2 family protein [Neisseria sp. MVDL19-042950]MDO1516817.1 SirB2 family protein [Neisseria sp. MVDL18-041461]MDO1563971.1 SirB2 family protein [Neisseria sp. MVDL20-010259]